MAFIPEMCTLAKGLVIYFARFKTKSISTDGLNFTQKENFESKH